MDATIAVLLGAAIGGFLSVLASWLSQSLQTRGEWVSREVQRRQQLYSDFIELAARCYADALQQDEPNAARLAKLYGEIGRMRLHSSESVLKEANLIAHKILNTFADANRSYTEIRDLLSSDSVELFMDFSEACRLELARLQPRFPVSRKVSFQVRAQPG